MAKDAAKDSIRITNVYAFMFDIACKVSELSNVMVKCHGELLSQSDCLKLPLLSLIHTIIFVLILQTECAKEQQGASKDKTACF